MNIRYTDSEMMHSYNFKLLQLNTDGLEIPETSYAIEYGIPTPELRTILRDLGAVGDRLCLDFKQNTVEFSTSGHNGSASILRHRGEGEDCKSTYSMRYLSLMTKFPLTKAIVLRLNPDIPLCLDYVMEGGHLAFFLAPTMQDD